MTTKYGQTHDCIVLTQFIKKTVFLLFNSKSRRLQCTRKSKAKAERYEKWANLHSKSNEYFEASQEGRDFLSLAEPIKVGHHSEKRHRALIERNWSRMGKSVEFSEKAESQ